MADRPSGTLHAHLHGVPTPLLAVLSPSLEPLQLSYEELVRRQRHASGRRRHRCRTYAVRRRCGRLSCLWVEPLFPLPSILGRRGCRGLGWHSTSGISRGCGSGSGSGRGVFRAQKSAGFSAHGFLCSSCHADHNIEVGRLLFRQRHVWAGPPRAVSGIDLFLPRIPEPTGRGHACGLLAFPPRALLSRGERVAHKGSPACPQDSDETAAKAAWGARLRHPSEEAAGHSPLAALGRPGRHRACSCSEFHRAHAGGESDPRAA